jgi:hypothetical protein
LAEDEPHQDKVGRGKGLALKPLAPVSADFNGGEPVNGCPRRDPRQNSAGLYAVREGQEFNEEIEESSPSKTLLVWEPLQSLGSSYQSSFLGQTIERG